MYGSILLFLVFSYSSYILAASFPKSEQLKIMLVNDYVKFEKRPTSIVAFLCWEHKYLKQLIKDISKTNFITGVMISNLDINKVNHFKPSHQILYLTDLNCKKGDEILIKGNELNLFAMPYRWLIFGDDNVPTLNILHTLNIFPSSELLLAVPLSNSSFQLFQPYKISPNKDNVIMEKYGIWCLENHIRDYRSTPIISRRRSNLQKSPFRTTHVYLDNDTLNHLDDYKNPLIDTITKVGYFLTKYLLDSLNVTMENKVTTAWGYRNPDGVTYTGLIGELMENRTDLGGTAMIFTKERIDVIKYLSPTSKTTGVFIFRQPPLSYVNNLFALPFTVQIWVLTILVIAVIDIFLYIAVTWEWKSEKLFKKVPIDSEGRLEAKYGDIILVSVASLCQQGAPVEPKSGSARIAFVFFVIFVMFTYTAYSAYIVVLLQTTSTAITTLKDLLESPLKIGAEDTVYYRYFLQNNENPIKRALNERKKPVYLSLADGVARLRQGQFAYLTQPGTSYKIVQDTFLEHEKCGLQEIDFMGISDIWSGTQKNSSYIELFKVGYAKIWERGIQIRENQYLFVSKPKCSGQGSHFTSVGLTESYFAFYIILTGVAISIGIFLLEIIISKRKSKNNSITGNRITGKPAFKSKRKSPYSRWFRH